MLTVMKIVEKKLSNCSLLFIVDNSHPKELGLGKQKKVKQYIFLKIKIGIWVFFGIILYINMPRKMFL